MTATTTIRTDAFREFSLDPRTNRFRIVDGSGRGRFISRAAFQSRLQAHIEQRQQDLVALADQYNYGTLTLEGLQRNAARIISDLHASESLRCVENLTNAEQQILLSEVQKQLYAGKDWETGKAYGIKSLAEELKDGSVSPAQLKARLSAYAQASRLTASRVELSIAKRQGKIYGVRRLTSGHQHCNECPGLQVLTPTLLENIQNVGEGCSCRSRCLCTITAMDEATAIANGLPDPRPARQRQRELEQIERAGFGQRRRR